MKKTYKTEIIFSDEQESKIYQTIGVCRYIYNFYISKNKEVYKQGKKFMTANDFSKWINNDFVPNNPDYKWIKSVSSKAIKQSMVNAERAFKRFFNKLSKFPKYKKKKNQDIKAYFPKNNETDWTIERHRIKIPTLGWVRLKEFGYIPVSAKVSSGTVSIKAGRFFVSVLCEVDKYDNNIEFHNKGLGIDLGLKEFACVSNGMSYKNINKTNKIRRLEKKLKREQRSLSRKYENLKKRGEKSATNKRANINKNILRVQRLHQRLNNIRLEYQKSIVNQIVKTKPSHITVEKLNVKGMMKSRHLAKAIKDQAFYQFKTWLLNGCKKFNIELREVGTFYPSSKICSCCGFKKTHLSLSERVYECSNCGEKMDRDLNASINLANATKYIILT